MRMRSQEQYNTNQSTLVSAVGKMFCAYGVPACKETVLHGGSSPSVMQSEARDRHENCPDLASRPVTKSNKPHGHRVTNVGKYWGPFIPIGHTLKD